MKFLRKHLDSIAFHFEKNGRFEKFYPLYEAIDSFLYSPLENTAGTVHARDALDLKRIMVTVVISLLPCVFMALWNTGFQANTALLSGNDISFPSGIRGDIFVFLGLSPDPSSLISCLVLGGLYFIPIFIVTNIVGGFWEVCFSIVRNKPINEGFLVTGFLFPLILPPDTPLWMVGMGISFGVVLAKEIFGGTGMNFMNVALVSRVFLFFAYPVEMSGDMIWIAVDGHTEATALGAVASGSAMPYSWTDSFLGFIPGSMGETSALACLLGGLYLTWTRVGSYQIILSMLGVFSLSILFVNYVGENPLAKLSLEWHLVIGGFAFGTVYMATDPVTASMTNTGRWIYGGLCGFLSALIRTLNPAFPEGVMLAILLGNVFAPTIDYFVVESYKRRRIKRDEQ